MTKSLKNVKNEKCTLKDLEYGVFGIFGAEKQQFEFKKMIGMALAIVGIIIFKWE